MCAQCNTASSLFSCHFQRFCSKFVTNIPLSALTCNLTKSCCSFELFSNTYHTGVPPRHHRHESGSITSSTFLCRRRTMFHEAGESRSFRWFYVATSKSVSMGSSFSISVTTTSSGLSAVSGCMLLTLALRTKSTVISTPPFLCSGVFFKIIAVFHQLFFPSVPSSVHASMCTHCVQRDPPDDTLFGRHSLQDFSFFGKSTQCGFFFQVSYLSGDLRNNSPSRGRCGWFGLPRSMPNHFLNTVQVTARCCSYCIPSSSGGMRHPSASTPPKPLPFPHLQLLFFSLELTG